MSMLVSMAAFALASSITPGPVNIVALGAGARYGLAPSLRYAAGATLGFVALFLLIGLGLHAALAHWPALTTATRWSGIAFLLYMALRLALDDGRLPTDAKAAGPSAATGAAMQWLNPKAWLACVAAMGAYASDGDRAQVWQFAALYLVICFASIACWSYAGASLRHRLANARRMRVFNRAMALLLAGSALLLLDV
ncbi:LysE family translocator [Burkholderia pseudomultivorans]|uniref:Cysteine/O-acetylserine efflux protein n=1 Tax=Burkholderia pseudomultivorans TaxID=1207504 RepID=A0A6P2P2E5_9BURK|nr:LysE family translocator [Burkholderia pseudomultivorans]MDR8730584.1 Cysteine/O-acetylserine efflux protein [Burkholderia pseudomultivorans]MDR8737692.1 Cysteine/O-acetylserine efflux protein [Burkholderia pseudomultivorans]MDR8745075.1 Cysteine/O-acetylserine efflux protein [Burkholderia pseudomultivorans]MDR8758188.1 Cysteine/O-acetylserine efflux protein [Burkholderia pseudomultivorans]MDR8781996.1 Cysteine/O-acetylserine efflux protein [Burkholderia pseudomultivorans]